MFVRSRLVTERLGAVAAIVMLLFGAAIAQQRTGSTFRTITISTQPGATVFVDGVRYGRANESGSLEIKTISSGAHTLKVRAPGFKDKTQPITAVQRGEIKVPLEKTEDKADLAYQEAERLTGVDREKAAEAFRKAIELRPHFLDAHLALARVLLDSGDTEDAMKALAAARRLKPGNPEASAIEGRIHKENGEETKAIAAYKRAITEGKGFQPEAYAGLGILYKEKAEGFGGTGDFANETLNYDESAKNLKMALKQLSGAPDTIVIYQLLGLIYERQNKYAEAIATYEEFLRIFPNATEATAVRSFIEQLKKDMAAKN